MTTDHDLDRVLDRWFAQREVQANGRVIDVVVGRVERQRQLPAWRVSWKDSHMNAYFKPLAAIAAVIAIAVVGYNLLPSGSTGVGGPRPTASPTAPTLPSAEPSNSPSPSLAYTWPRSLEAGTYTTRLIWDIPFAVQFTVPDGWESRDVEVIHGDRSVAFHLAGNTYGDPCGGVASDPPTGPTVDDLANAITALPAFDATGPRPVTLDGVAGLYLELVVRKDAGCANPGLWADPPNAYNGDGPVGPPSWGAEVPNLRMWILDVDGTRFVVSALWPDSATAADLAELQAVVDSIRIVRSSSGSSPPS